MIEIEPSELGKRQQRSYEIKEEQNKRLKVEHGWNDTKAEIKVDGWEEVKPEEPTGW